MVLSPVATILFDTASFITASEVIFSFTSVFNPIPLLTDVVGDSFSIDGLPLSKSLISTGILTIIPRAFLDSLPVVKYTEYNSFSDIVCSGLIHDHPSGKAMLESFSPTTPVIPSFGSTINVFVFKIVGYAFPCAKLSPFKLTPVGTA